MGNDPVNLIDPDGMENIAALEWAKINLVDKGIVSDYEDPWYGSADGGWTFQPGIIPTRMVCYESIFIAYMHSGGNITPYLKRTGFSTSSGGFKGRSSESGGINWFKAGKRGSYRSFVTDILKGELGDIVFMGETGDMMGHSVMLACLPVKGSYVDESNNIIETISFYALSTSSDSDPNAYGTRVFIFEKQEDGSWLSRTGKQFRGYGQLDENKLKGDKNLYPTIDQTSTTSDNGNEITIETHE
jgi:hypothetical protein